MSGSAWSLNASVKVGDLDWFLQRLTRARALIPAASFDTINGEDFSNTITSELVNTGGNASADGASYNGGVVSVAVGDAVIASSFGRLQPVQPPSHVGSLTGKSWYAASLVRITRPGDAEIPDTQADALGLWDDASNNLGLGIYGSESAANWVGHSVSGGSGTNVQGPALDGAESSVWHLFEMWFDVDAGLLRFAIDGTTFINTIAVADMPSVPAWWGMVSQRDAVGDQVISNYDKVCVITASPRVGGID